MHQPVHLSSSRLHRLICRSLRNFLVVVLALGLACFALLPGTVRAQGGDLFVAYGFPTGTVGKYDATTGAPLNATLISGLNNLTGIAVVSAPDPSCTGTLLLLSLMGTFGLQLLLRQPEGEIRSVR